MKIVIVGGVAGGATAAARIRRLDEQAEIHSQQPSQIPFSTTRLTLFIIFPSLCKTSF